MLVELLTLEKSFQGFKYPKAFLKAVELNLIEFQCEDVNDDF